MNEITNENEGEDRIEADAVRLIMLESLTGESSPQDCVSWVQICAMYLNSVTLLEIICSGCIYCGRFRHKKPTDIYKALSETGLELPEENWDDQQLETFMKSVFSPLRDCHGYFKILNQNSISFSYSKTEKGTWVEAMSTNQCSHLPLITSVTAEKGRFLLWDKSKLEEEEEAVPFATISQKIARIPEIAVAFYLNGSREPGGYSQGEYRGRRFDSDHKRERGSLPVLKLNGPILVKITEGVVFRDQGCYAEIEGTDVSDLVQVRGEVNSSIPGTYTLLYSLGGDRKYEVVRVVEVIPKIRREDLSSTFNPVPLLPTNIKE